MIMPPTGIYPNNDRPNMGIDGVTPTKNGGITT